MRLHAALPGSRPGPVWPWLVTIARNICTDIKRNRARIAAWDESPRERLASDIEGDPEEEVAHRIRKQLLDEAMQSLPGRYRSFVRLRDFDGWSYEEIARLHGVSIASVRSVLLRARRSLKKEVETLARAKGQWPLPAVLPGPWVRFRTWVDERYPSIQGTAQELIARAAALPGLQAILAVGPAFTHAATAGVAIVALLTLGGSAPTPQDSISNVVSHRTVSTPAPEEQSSVASHSQTQVDVSVVPANQSPASSGGTVYNSPTVAASFPTGSEDEAGEDFEVSPGPVSFHCPPPEKRGLTQNLVCPVLEDTL